MFYFLFRKRTVIANGRRQTKHNDHTFEREVIRKFNRVGKKINKNNYGT